MNKTEAWYKIHCLIGHTFTVHGTRNQAQTIADLLNKRSGATTSNSVNHFYKIYQMHDDWCVERNKNDDRALDLINKLQARG